MMSFGSVALGQPPAANTVVMELFVRGDSDQCQAAARFLADMQDRRTGVEVVMHDVKEDRDALVRLWKLAKQFGHEKAGVPSVFAADRWIVGFRDAQTTGRDLENLLQIHAYVRPGCRHCRDARIFLDDLCRRWPALRVQYHDVVNDPQARAEVAELTKRYQVRAVSFPCIQVAGRLVVGYRGPEITGRRIEEFFRHPTAGDDTT